MQALAPARAKRSTLQHVALHTREIQGTVGRNSLRAPHLTGSMPTLRAMAFETACCSIAQQMIKCGRRYAC